MYLIHMPKVRSVGMPDPDGTAVVIQCVDILELERYLYFLSNELNTKLFEIVPVELMAAKLMLTMTTPVLHILNNNALQLLQVKPV